MKFFLKGFMLTITLLLTLLCFMGCEQPVAVQPLTEGYCIIQPTEEKGLVSSVDSAVTEYLYKATPRFSGATSGTTNEWSHLSYGNQGTIGLLTQGKWFFEIQGLNSQGTIITVGSVESYIDAGKTNIIDVQMKTDPTVGKGSISYTIWTQNVSSTGTMLKVYERVTGTTSWTKISEHTDITQEHVKLSGQIQNLISGYHDVLFLLFDNNGAALGGEQLGVQVVAGQNTAISGIIEPTYEIGLDLTIKSMGYVHGLLDPSSDILIEGTGRERVAYMERGDTVTFSWVDQEDASSVPTEWIWAFDGEIVSGATEKTYTVAFDKYGEHELSVVGIRKDKDGVTWDAGSAVIRIVVVRHICEITFMANGGFYSDGTDTYIISEDTTLPETRKIPGGQPYDGLSPQRTGYVLTGWQDVQTGETVVNIAKDGTVTFLDGFVTKKDTRTLKATWVPGEYTLTVIWGENVSTKNGAVPYSQEYKIKCGDPLTLLDDKATRQGFIFHGYTTEENGRGEVISSSDKYIWGRDTTIYANWEYIPINVGFYKSYSDYLRGAAPYKTIQVGSDLRYGSLPQPLRQGKVFKGWAQPEDVDNSQTEISEGHKYLTANALKSGKSFVAVNTFVRKYSDHVLVSVWGEGDIKISFDYANAALTSAGQSSINQFDQDSVGTYYKYGALGTMYGALPFTGIETEVRDGWEFMGWYDSPSYSMRVYEVSAVSTMEDHVLYGKWEGKRITVSFSTGTGETFPDKEVRYGASYGILPSPARYGYDFLGWYLGNKLIEESTYVENGNNHTLVAKWKAKETSLTINPNGGTWNHPTEMTILYDEPYANASSGNIKFGDSSTSDGLKSPTRYGYDFAGWFNNPGGSGNRIKGTTINKLYTPQTFYALWNAHSHQLIFHYQWPGTTSEPDTSYSSMITFGSSYGGLPAPSYVGYTFNGWYTEPSSGTQVSASTKYLVDENVNLYARWTVLKVSISFYEEGNVCVDSTGKALSPVIREYGKTYGPLPVPAKKGYKFTGKWSIAGVYDSSGQQLRVTDSSTVNVLQDVTLTPIWEPDDILVFVPYDGELSEGGEVISLDTSKYELFSVKYGSTFNNLFKTTITGTTWKATTTSGSLPTWTKTGYWQDSWRLLVPGKGYSNVDPSAALTDFSKFENEAKEKIGQLTPDQVVYFIPCWQKNRYTITFANRFYNGTTISAATGAPYKQPVSAEYLDTLSDAMESSIMDDWEPEWEGYKALGWYYDAECTKEVKPTDKLGVEVCSPNASEVVLYIKWVKVNTQYIYSTNSSILYPANSRNIVYKNSDIFASAKVGWSDFVGVVDEQQYSDGSLRKVAKEGDSITLFEETYNMNVNHDARTFTTPGVGNIVVSEYDAMDFTYVMVCSTCGGKGWSITEEVEDIRKEDEGHNGYQPFAYGETVGLENGNVIRLAYKNGTYYYASNTMKRYDGETYTVEQHWYSANYPSCPQSSDRHGCIYWPSKLLGSKAMECPSCNGNPYYDRVAVRTRTIDHDGSCNDTCPDDCTEDHSWSETVNYVSLDTCYCVRNGTPGKIPAGKSYLGWFAGYTNVYKNNSVIAYDNAATSASYIRCTSPNMPYSTNTFGFCYNYPTYSATNHYDDSYMKSLFSYPSSYCTNCEGPRATVRRGPAYPTSETSLSSRNYSMQKGDVFKVEMWVPDIRDGNYIQFNDQGSGHIKIDDVGAEYGLYSLTLNGKDIFNTSYDNYRLSGGKYCTIGSTSITTEPTRYYGFSGALIRKDIANGIQVGNDKTEKTGVYEVDSSKEYTFRYVTASGKVHTGRPTNVIWNTDALIINYIDSSGTAQNCTLLYRTDNTGLANPAASLELSFWKKE